MVSRSTEYRRRKGLTQVSFDIDEELWPIIFEVTGARNKTKAVRISLRPSL